MDGEGGGGGGMWWACGVGGGDRMSRTCGDADWELFRKQKRSVPRTRVARLQQAGDWLDVVFDGCGRSVSGGNACGTRVGRIEFVWWAEAVEVVTDVTGGLNEWWHTHKLRYAYEAGVLWMGHVWHVWHVCDGPR